MAFGVVLFVASWTIIRSALQILLERTPANLDLKAAMRAIEDIDAVIDVHHVHAWSLTAGRNVVSAHIRVRNPATDGERVLREAGDRLKNRFKVYFSTLQIEDEPVAAEERASAIDITQGNEMTCSRRDADHGPH
jgi:cobalt-zinc-cadmium efflux system protein